MRTNSNITIYNKYIVSKAEKYQRTQLGMIGGQYAVEWEDRKAANVLASGGNIQSNSVTIYIPFSRGENYLEAKEWLALVDKTGKWTLQEGDIVVKGLVDDEITDAITDPETDEVTPAFTVTMLKAKYNKVLFISSIDAKDMGSFALRHWLVGGK